VERRLRWHTLRSAISKRCLRAGMTLKPSAC
jgi:hypothetical protein